MSPPQSNFGLDFIFALQMPSMYYITPNSMLLYRISTDIKKKWKPQKPDKVNPGPGM
ncbi:hypothetical protein BJY01DRAFT_205009 [Aspergillus pseudoustus]|uniref:Uncharacterized protein n=1 Tax=Aspergillus pseudoustus TaxID=1810923 RepID=A0ABR4KRJ9_9EURO